MSGRDRPAPHSTPIGRAELKSPGSQWPGLSFAPRWEQDRDARIAVKASGPVEARFGQGRKWNPGTASRPGFLLCGEISNLLVPRRCSPCRHQSRQDRAGPPQRHDFADRPVSADLVETVENRRSPRVCGRVPVAPRQRPRAQLLSIQKTNLLPDIVRTRLSPCQARHTF